MEITCLHGKLIFLIGKLPVLGGKLCALRGILRVFIGKLRFLTGKVRVRIGMSDIGPITKFAKAFRSQIAQMGMNARQAAAQIKEIKGTP